MHNIFVRLASCVQYVCANTDTGVYCMLAPFASPVAPLVSLYACNAQHTIYRFHQTQYPVYQ